MDLLIRPIAPEDTAAVLSLYREAVLAIPPEVFSPPALREWAGRTEDEFRRLGESRARFVAQIGTTIVGYSGLDPARSTLTECYVLPSHQGRGIGKRLVGHVIAEARNQRLAGLQVLASINAAPFYAKMGFSEVSPESFVMADGQTLPCMRMAAVFAPA